MGLSDHNEKKKLLLLDMVHHNPAEGYTQSSFRNPQKLASYGYDGKVINDFKFAHCAITYDSFDENIFPSGSDERSWVKEAAIGLQQHIDRCKNAGIDAYCFIDIIVLPKTMVNLYGDELLNYNGEISIHQHLTQKIHRIMIDEIFSSFPDLDGLIVRTGETYLHNVPFHTGNNPIIRGEQSHKVLLNILREEVCEKRNKKLIYRTWDFGYFHTQPDYYLNVTNAIDPHENLYFSIKHTEGDYHRTFPFNPTITLGKHKQVIEVQCQREYEGKGAHPNYVMQGVINGFEEYQHREPPKSIADILDHPTYAGIWSWSRGGGWVGPYIKNEFWCELNAYVISQFAKEPFRGEEEIFNEYARKKGIDGRNLDKFRKLALLSAKGVVRGHSSLIVPVNVWWTRDHFFGGLNELQESFDNIINNSLVDEVLQEKRECVNIWKEIVLLSNEMDISDKELEQFIRTSSQYGLIKYSIIEQSWIILLKGLEGERSGNFDSETMHQALKKYDDLWDQFRKLEETNKNCATIYKPYAFDYHAKNYKGDEGLETSVNKYRKLISTK